MQVSVGPFADSQAAVHIVDSFFPLVPDSQARQGPNSSSQAPPPPAAAAEQERAAHMQLQALPPSGTVDSDDEFEALVRVLFKESDDTFFGFSQWTEPSDCARDAAPSNPDVPCPEPSPGGAAILRSSGLAASPDRVEPFSSLFTSIDRCQSGSDPGTPHEVVV